MTKDEALKLTLDWLEGGNFVYPTELRTAIKEALAQPDTFERGRQEGMKQERALWELSRVGQEIEAQPVQEPVLQEIEQYRLQMAAISTAAIGYWKDGEGINPDYATVALHDVVKLYAKYDNLYKAKEALAQPVQEPVAQEKPYAQVLVDWFDEANGFSQGTKAPHKWVLQAQEELRLFLHRTTPPLPVQPEQEPAHPWIQKETLRSAHNIGAKP